MTSFSAAQVFLVTIVFLIISMVFMLLNSNKEKNLPPSPPRLPVIGNIHQLGHTPHLSLQRLSHKYGPIMLLHFGSVPTIVVSSAEAAEEITKTCDLSFSSRPSLHIINILLYGSKTISFAPYGEYWRQLKSISVVHLLSSARVKSFQKVRESEISLLIERLRESNGSLVDVNSLLTSFTIDITCKVSFGRTYDVSKIMHLLQNLINLIAVFSVGSYIPWLSWVDQVTGLVGRAKRSAKQMDEFLESIIRDHENMKSEVDDGRKEDEEDLVDTLLDIHKNDTTGFTLDRDTIKGVLLDVIIGGTETTSSTLEWTISELLRHPGIMKNLQQEVIEIAQGKSMIQEEDLKKMQYLKAVIKESLRMYPSLPLLAPHISTEDVEVMGYCIPSNTQLLINAWVIGRDASKWEEPNEFRPERFLNKSIDYKGVNFEWLPFGAGRRRCPGIQFGVAIIELALANIVYKFDLALPHGVKSEHFDTGEISGLTFHRKFPLKLKASPRF